VQSYNLKVMRFPSSVIASVFGFKTREAFKAVSGSEVAPSVKF
jgi:LemA protein